MTDVDAGPSRFFASKVVTVYYFWDQKTGPERYIAATIWNPD
jgi:hypothetical protein